MGSSLRLFTLAAAGLLATACPEPFEAADAGGTPPDAGGGPPDGGAPRPDVGVPDAGGAPPPTVRVTGTVIKLDTYLRGQPSVTPGVELRVLGTEQIPPVTSADPYGTYALQVPQNGKVVVRAAKTGYVSTYTELTVAAAPILGRSVYLSPDTYVQNLATARQVDLAADHPCHPPIPAGRFCRYAVIVGRVVDDGSADNGTPTPVAGATQAEFTVYGNNDATWYKKGPYFLTPLGVPDANLNELTRERDANQKYIGGLYYVFVETETTAVDPIDVEIKVVSNAGGAVPRQFGPVQVKVFNGGMHWVSLPEVAVTQPPPPPQNINFETQVYPLFKKVNEGGGGCLGCHTSEGGTAPSAGMDMYGGPAMAYAAINPATYPNRVNLANPAQSLVLTKPLYETNGVQDHPIFFFPSTQDPSYQLIYQWIREGAVYQGGTPPPVSFANQIRPLLYRDVAQGGLGCYGCHVQGVDATTAPGGFYMGGTPAELFAELTTEPPTDNGGTGEPYRINKTGNAGASLLLLNPLAGSNEPHPAKLIPGAADPSYQLIYRWITEGYTNDAP